MSTTAENIISKLDLESFFDDKNHKFNLQIGTVFNQGGTRIVYLSSDIIQGIYNALEYEAGDAWRIILKNCGHIWGKRVADNLDRELGLMFKLKQGELSVEDYLAFIENYFSHHGWGILESNIEHAATKGLVFFTLKNGLFRHVLNSVDGFVDQMIEGMLRSLMEHISGHSLECAQFSEDNDGGNKAEFVVTVGERLEEIHPMIEDRVSRDAIFDKLLA